MRQASQPVIPCPAQEADELGPQAADPGVRRAPPRRPSSPAISAPEYSYTYFSVNSRLSAGLRAQHGGPYPVPRQGVVRPAAFHQDVLLQGEAGRRVRVRRRLSARLRASTHT